MIINTEVSKKDLVKELEKAIELKNLGIFIGAGLSIDAGFCNWKGLLEEPAKEMGLDIEKEYDLVSLAQYYSNTFKREAINNLFKEKFPTSVLPSENHKLLSQLPISVYWTTNYDKLMENALKENNKRPCVKTSDEQLTEINSNVDAIVYKLHGDIDSPEDAVITRSDYEEFGYNKRKLFREILEGDLLSKTFLFLGFSFSDPNFNYVIGKLRVLLEEKNVKKHYCIMKKETSKYEKIKQNLQVEDLKRYGIHTCLVEDYKEITEILKILVNKYRRKRIFISGSAYNYGNLSKEKGRNFIHKLAFKLSENGYTLVNGYGKGVGEFILNGVADYCLKQKDSKIGDILTLVPFSQNTSYDIDLEEVYKENRKQLLESCGIAIFIFGNKETEKIAEGVLKEYKLASSLNIICLPIKNTYGAANDIYNEISKNNISEEVKKAIDISNNSEIEDIDSTVSNILEAVNFLNGKE